MANIWYGANRYPPGRSAPDGNWQNTLNWYLNPGTSGCCGCPVNGTPANRVPTNADVVYMQDGATVTTGPAATFSGAVNIGDFSAPMLSAGTFSGAVNTLIGGGTYTGTVNSTSYAIFGGTFNCPTIAGVGVIGGTFNGNTTLLGTVQGGTFNGAIQASSSFSVTGGTFNVSLLPANTVTSISGGTFLAAAKSRAVTGGIFNSSLVILPQSGVFLSGAPDFTNATSITIGDATTWVGGGQVGVDPFPKTTSFTFNKFVTVYVTGQTTTDSTCSGIYDRVNFNAGMALIVQARCLDSAQPNFYPCIVFKNCTRMGLPFNSIYQDILGAGL